MAKVYNSFKDLAEVFGIEDKQVSNNRNKKKKKVFACRQCGSEMYHVPNTNVFVCPECKDIDKDGNIYDHSVLVSKAF